MRGDLPTKDVEYSVKITDNLGTEKLTSIKDYTPALLPNSTESVRLSWKNGYSGTTRVELTIAFHGQAILAGVALGVVGANARELVVAVHDAIDRILEPHLNNHRWYHPFSASEIILPLVAFFLLALFSALRQQYPAASAAMAITGFILLWVWISSLLKPWIAFDTPRQRRKDAVWKWMSLGFLSFVLFGTLLPQLRKILLGF